MRIGLNLLYLLPGVVGGTETYAKYLIQALAALDTSNEYLIFLNQESAEFDISAGDNFTRVVLPLRATNRIARYAWEQTMFSRELRRRNVTVLHSLGYVGPRTPPCRHVVSIHDLNFASEYVQMSTVKRRVLGSFVVAVGRRADHILTLSDCSKEQIVRRLGVRPDTVTTTYLAADPQTVAAVVAARPSVDRSGTPYIVVFGSSTPHKNIPRLIAAFASICDRIPHNLVVIGHVPSDGSTAAAITRYGLGNRVIATGYLPSAAMAVTLAGAELLVFPSLYEGFGLPVLDAQAVGLPVVCSSAAALPEVAGYGAALFDPLSVDSIASAIVSPLSDRAIRERLIKAGTRNVHRFSWQRTATLTLQAYTHVARVPK